MLGQVAAVGIEHLEKLTRGGRGVVRQTISGKKREKGVGERMYLCTGFHLADQEIYACVRDELEECLGLGGVFEQPGFRLLERLVPAALDHVRHERPGGTAEADERDAAGEAGACQGDGVVHVLEPFVYTVRLQILHVFGDIERFREDGAGVHEHLHAHGLGDDEDVGEDDGGIDKAWITIDGLQGDLCCELWILA